MTFPFPVYFVPLALGILAILWLITSPIRRPRKLEELLPKIQPELADNLMLFIEKQCFVSSDSLNQAIGGWRGILKIHQQAGYIASVCHLLANVSVKDEPELEEIVLATMYLRFITPFCLLEMSFHALFALANSAASTSLRIPRISTWGYARLYCDMVSSITATVADSGLSSASAVAV